MTLRAGGWTPIAEWTDPEGLFAVILADDLIDAEVPALKQMAEVHAKRGGSVVTTMS